MKFIFSLLLISLSLPAFGTNPVISYVTTMNTPLVRVYQDMKMPNQEELTSNPCQIISGDTLKILGGKFKDPVVNLYSSPYIYGPVENQSPRVKDQNCAPKFVLILLPNIKEVPDLSALLNNPEKCACDDVNK